jgi:hypothetical protein
VVKVITSMALSMTLAPPTSLTMWIGNAASCPATQAGPPGSSTIESASVCEKSQNAAMPSVPCITSEPTGSSRVASAAKSASHPSLSFAAKAAM